MQFTLPLSVSLIFIENQARIQNFSLGGADPEAIYNLYSIVKIML
jgi:hypothetical protein